MQCKDCGARGRKLSAPGPRCSQCLATNEGQAGIRSHAAGVLRNYGVTGDEYHKLLEYQNGVCAICGDPPTDRRLSVDHDHRCCETTPTCGNCNRSALLCFTCNTLLGRLENKYPDNREYLRRIMNYLDKTEDAGMSILWDIREKLNTNVT